MITIDTGFWEWIGQCQECGKTHTLITREVVRVQEGSTTRTKIKYQSWEALEDGHTYHPRVGLETANRMRNLYAEWIGEQERERSPGSSTS